MMPAADVSTSAWPQTKALTISAARRLLTEKFRAAGIETPELDARVLVAHALSLDHAGLAAAGMRMLDAGEWDAIGSFAERRLMHEPVARIVGFKEFWSLRLQIDSTTLVPRPETETLVEAALAEIDSAGARTRPMRIADLGTGSGAILLALLSELPNAFGVGTDTSFGALRSRSTTPSVCSLDAQRLSLATSARHSPDRLILLSPTRPISRRVRLPRLRPMCATTIRGRRSTAGTMGSTVTGRSPRRSRLCLMPRALWWSNWAPAKQPPSAHCFRKRALRPPAHVPILGVRRVPSSPEKRDI